MTIAPATTSPPARHAEPHRSDSGSGSLGLTSGHTDPRLDAIAAKVDAGQRLSLDDGMVLYETADIWGVLALADRVRRRLHGDIAYYNINRHMNYSNVCALSCKFCEFYRKKDQPGAYTRDNTTGENGKENPHLSSNATPTTIPVEQW